MKIMVSAGYQVIDIEDLQQVSPEQDRSAYPDLLL